MNSPRGPRQIELPSEDVLVEQAQAFLLGSGLKFAEIPDGELCPPSEERINTTVKFDCKLDSTARKWSMSELHRHLNDTRIGLVYYDANPSNKNDWSSALNEEEDGYPHVTIHVPIARFQTDPEVVRSLPTRELFRGPKCGYEDRGFQRVFESNEESFGLAVGGFKPDVVGRELELRISDLLGSMDITDPELNCSGFGFVRREGKGEFVRATVDIPFENLSQETFFQKFSRGSRFDREGCDVVDWSVVSNSDGTKKHYHLTIYFPINLFEGDEEMETDSRETCEKLRADTSEQVAMTLEDVKKTVRGMSFAEVAELYKTYRDQGVPYRPGRFVDDMIVETWEEHLVAILFEKLGLNDLVNEWVCAKEKSEFKKVSIFMGQTYEGKYKAVLWTKSDNEEALMQKAKAGAEALGIRVWKEGETDNGWFLLCLSLDENRVNEILGGK